MIKNIGVNDHKIDLFEGQYIVKNGMRYNSYVILGEEACVMDTVDIEFTDLWLANLEEALAGRSPKYLVVTHMEPDHSASLDAFFRKYPDTTLVTNKKAYNMVGQFFPELKINNFLEVKENDTLDLGGHTLKFIMAPMVHWPEVMMAYETTDKALFSADAFGKFGALDIEEDWLGEARRYYIGIVGKYGSFVQQLFKKLSALEIEKIYSLHGPALTSNLAYYLGYYDKWSKYEEEDNKTLIAYASIYGNTKKAAEMLYDELGHDNAVLMDLARCDKHEAIAQAFAHKKLCIASPTYNGALFPCVQAFLDGLTERGYQNRVIATIDNGTWGPMTRKLILKELESAKNLIYTEATVTIKSALNSKSIDEIKALALELK